MRVGLNLLYLKPGLTGGGETYARHLVSNLLAEEGAQSFVAFVTRDFDADWLHSPLLTVVRAGLRSGDIARRFWWEQMVLPALSPRKKIDVLHSLGYVAPLLSTVPSVVTIHDLNTQVLRNEISWTKSVVLGGFVRHSARRAALVLTGSDYSKASITSAFDLPSARVVVTRYGSDHAEGLPESDPETLRTRFGLPASFLLVLGGAVSHKNVELAITAYRQAASAFPHDLVIAGNLSEACRRAATEASDSRIRILGYVSDADLRTLYRLASILIVPSRYEGFGFPPLEAQRVGTPVAVSRIPTFRETLQDSALFFDPASPSELASVMIRVTSDEALRESLASAGRANTSRFQWRDTARATRAAYERALGDQP